MSIEQQLNWSEALRRSDELMKEGSLGLRAPLIGHSSAADCALSKPATLPARACALRPLLNPARSTPPLTICSLALSIPRTCSLLPPAMAAVASTSAVVSSCLLHKPFASNGLRAASARPVAGLPALRMPKIVCSAQKESSEVTGLPQLAAAVTSAATLAYAHPVVALVDERLSTEGTGLGLGLSNSKLTWILVGVTALIWALYFTYASKLPDSGDDSGLDL